MPDALILGPKRYMLLVGCFSDRHICKRISGFLGLFNDDFPISLTCVHIPVVKFFSHLRIMCYCLGEININVCLSGMIINGKGIPCSLRINDTILPGLILADDLRVILHRDRAFADVLRQYIVEYAHHARGVGFVVKEGPDHAVIGPLASARGHRERAAVSLPDGHGADQLLQVRHFIIDRRTAHVHARFAEGHDIVDDRRDLNARFRILLGRLDRSMIHISPALGNMLFHRIIAEDTRAIRAVGALAAMAGVLNGHRSINTRLFRSALINHLRLIGDDHRALARFVGHIEVEQRNIAEIVIAVIRIGHSARHIIVQLHSRAIAHLDHHVALQGLQVGHLVKDMDAGHVGRCVADRQGVGQGGARYPLVVLGGRIGGDSLIYRNNLLFFVGDRGLLSGGSILAMLLRGVNDIRRIVYAVALRGRRVDQLHGIPDLNRPLARGAFGEGVIEEGRHILAVAGISNALTKVDFLGLTIVSHGDLALRDDHVRHGIGDAEAGQVGLLIAIGDGIAHHVAGLVGGAADGLGDRDRILGLVDFHGGFAAGDILVSVDPPVRRIGFSGLLFRHRFKLRGSNLGIVGHLVAALGHAGGTQRGGDIKGKAVAGRDHADGLAADLDAGSVQRLEAAQHVVEGHRIQIGVDVDIRRIMQCVISVRVRTGFVDGFASLFHRLLVMDGDRIRRAGEFIGPLVIRAQFCFVSLQGCREETGE